MIFGNNPASYFVVNKKKKTKKRIKRSKNWKNLFDDSRPMHQNLNKQPLEKLIEQIRPEELPESKRRSPFIQFKPNRKCGNKIVGSSQC